MNDSELEAWLASRLGSAPSPEPTPRLVALVHAGRQGGAQARKLSLAMPGWLSTGRRRVAGLVGLAACVALAGGLLLRLPAATSPSPGASASPSIGPTESPSASPLPSASPTPGATATAVEATVVARIADCHNQVGWDYAVSGNDLFVVCDAVNSPSSSAAPGGPYIERVDLTTNKVTATYRYKTPITYIEGLTIADGSLWWSGIFGGSCSGDCRGWRRLERFDVATGKNTVEIPDVGLVGSSPGYIWVRDSSTNTGSATVAERPLRGLDPTTGREKGRIPFSMDNAAFACGSLWGMTTSGDATASTSTTIARIDPANGKILAQFTVPGYLSSLQSVGGQCWASVKMSPGHDADHFIRIGDSGLEYTSPLVDVTSPWGNMSTYSQTYSTYVDIQGGFFWLVKDDGVSTATLQRLDPSTWQPTGTLWQVRASEYLGDPFAIIGGSVWAFDNNGGPSRLDIPLGQ
jgi:hypothetical protein